jgi:hypothetical protein
MLVLDTPPSTRDEIAASIEAAHARVGAEQLALLRSIAQMPREGDWEAWGAKDYHLWLAMFVGVSFWKASRMIDAAAALPSLPRIAGALGDRLPTEGAPATAEPSGLSPGR